LHGEHVVGSSCSVKGYGPPAGLGRWLVCSGRGFWSARRSFRESETPKARILVRNRACLGEPQAKRVGGRVRFLSRRASFYVGSLPCKRSRQ
jgi:hypothetical protein